MTETADIHPVRAAREAQGLSREDLASKAGVSFDTIERIEAGKGARRATKTVVALALGCNPNELFEPQEAAA